MKKKKVKSEKKSEEGEDKDEEGESLDSIAPVINYNKFGSLKQHKSISFSS